MSFSRGGGRVGRSDATQQADSAAFWREGAARWLNEASADPAVLRALQAVPSAVAVAAVEGGLPAPTLRRIAVAHGAPRSSSLGDCVRVLGAARVAGMCGETPAALLDRANVGEDMAIAAGVLQAPRCGASSCECGCSSTSPNDAMMLGGIDDTGPVPGVNSDLPDGPTPGDLVVIPSPTHLPPDGFPASPPFRPGNWDFPGSRYMIASGDTFAGLARLYLGGPGRWKELWAPNKGTFAAVDQVPVGAWIVMPQEATKSAQALMKSPTVPKSPASPGAPGSVPGQPDPGDPSKPGVVSPWRTVGIVGAVAGAVVVVGAVAYGAAKR